METIISRIFCELNEILMWTHCSYSGREQMVTMTKWLCPRMIQSHPHEFQSSVITTHTIQQLQNQTWPKGDIPTAFVLKTLISFPSHCGNSVPQPVTESVPLQQKQHRVVTACNTREVWKSLYFIPTIFECKWLKLIPPNNPFFWFVNARHGVHIQLTLL